jgi:hypothetical protein
LLIESTPEPGESSVGLKWAQTRAILHVERDVVKIVVCLYHSDYRLLTSELAPPPPDITLSLPSPAFPPAGEPAAPKTHHNSLRPAKIILALLSVGMLDGRFALQWRQSVFILNSGGIFELRIGFIWRERAP